MGIEILIYSLILLSSIPVGFFLAWLCDDEMNYGKKWLKLLLYVLILAVIVVFWFYYDLPILLSLIYLVILTLIGFLKKSKKR